MVYFGDRHSIPAEVCWTCSESHAGQWTPVTQCEFAKAQMTDKPMSLYADVVYLSPPDDHTPPSTDPGRLLMIEGRKAGILLDWEDGRDA